MMLQLHGHDAAKNTAQGVGKEDTSRPIGEDQLRDYARRRGMEPDTLRRFLV